MNRGSEPRETNRDAAGIAHCVIVAGANGAGKTTASHALVTERHGIQRIVNPDAIAVGLAGVAELGAIPAGKLALEAQRRYVDERADFATYSFRASTSGNSTTPRRERERDASRRAGATARRSCATTRSGSACGTRWCYDRRLHCRMIHPEKRPHDADRG